MGAIRQLCFSCSLATSRHRSTCWRLLLQCVPQERERWRDAIVNSRQLYADLRGMVMLNPRRLAKVDVTRVNPLSLDEDVGGHEFERGVMIQNPWTQYFVDNDLRTSIHQDVMRTFPELEYFQNPTTRQMMCDILFVYARHHPHIEYKQGMHEILGPLIFVMFADQQAYAHSAESTAGLRGLDGESAALLRLLHDERHLEHDS